MRTKHIMPALPAAALALLLLSAGGSPPGGGAGAAPSAAAAREARGDLTGGVGVFAGGARRAVYFAAAGEGELAEQARRALARMPAAERLAEVRDERVRRAVRAAYAAVTEIADNRVPGREASLNAKFERAYGAVGRAVVRSGHKTCARNCEADGADCQSGCKAAGRKSCGCRLATFACFVAECVL